MRANACVLIIDHQPPQWSGPHAPASGQQSVCIIHAQASGQKSGDFTQLEALCGMPHLVCVCVCVSHLTLGGGIQVFSLPYHSLQHRIQTLAVPAQARDLLVSCIARPAHPGKQHPSTYHALDYTQHPEKNQAVFRALHAQGHRDTYHTSPSTPEHTGCI
eukprot:1161140-Pelagomonas_calceolata.AAC.19